MALLDAGVPIDELVLIGVIKIAGGNRKMKGFMNER